MLSLQDKSSYEYEYDYESMIPSYKFMRYKFIEESIVHYSEVVQCFCKGQYFCGIPIWTPFMVCHWRVISGIVVPLVQSLHRLLRIISPCRAQVLTCFILINVVFFYNRDTDINSSICITWLEKRPLPRISTNNFEM